MKVGKPNEGLNRRRTVDAVGQLYPVLLSKDGQVIDGFHRLNGNPDWKTQTLEHIDSDEKLLLARAISNWHRRSISKEEKIAWINGLAQLYLDQGFMVLDNNHSTSGTPANQIVDKIKLELGISHPTIMRFLHDKYKQKSFSVKKTGPRVKASKIINNLSKNRGHSGGNLIERHEKEIRERLLHDEGFRKDVLIQIDREALAMEDENEDDPELQALTTKNFNNVIFQYQDGLRQLEANPTLGGIFDNKERYRLKSYGIIERQYKVFRVHVLTPDAQNVLLNIEG